MSNRTSQTVERKTPSRTETREAGCAALIGCATSNSEKLSSTIFVPVNIGRNECRWPKTATSTRMNTSRNRVKPSTKPKRSSSWRERNCSKSESGISPLIKLWAYDKTHKASQPRDCQTIITAKHHRDARSGGKSERSLGRIPTQGNAHAIRLCALIAVPDGCTLARTERATRETRSPQERCAVEVGQETIRGCELDMSE